MFCQVTGKHGSLKRDFKHLPIELFLSDGGKKAQGKSYDLSCWVSWGTKHWGCGTKARNLEPVHSAQCGQVGLS